jgi:sulfatase modifying factor 1
MHRDPRTYHNALREIPHLLVCTFACGAAFGCAELAGYDGYTFDGRSGGSGGQDGHDGTGGSPVGGNGGPSGGTMASGGASGGGVNVQGGSGGATGGTGGTSTGGASAGSTGISVGGVTTGVGGDMSNGGTPSVGGVTNIGGTTPSGGAATGGTAAGGTGGRPDPPSCQGVSFRCGNPGETCCTTIHLDGGQLAMGRGIDNDVYPSGMTNEVPEHTATVSSFAFDKYEVTVGRMRSFLNDYNRWRAAGNPKANDGANPSVTSSVTGWQSTWTLPGDVTSFDANLRCDASAQTWTAGNDSYPINCVNWYEAFAFCIWDVGRLPTEAEWESAAAGGDANRLYPWGAEDPGSARANYSGSAYSPFIAVGSYPAGKARWGHADLAGSVSEWVLDWYQSDWYSRGGNVCNNCANLAAGLSTRVIRSGGWHDPSIFLRAAFRFGDYDPTVRNYSVGFRCARTE